MKLSCLLSALLCNIVFAFPANTVTSQSRAVTTASACNITGLQWGYYLVSPFTARPESVNNYDPTLIKNMTPQATGRTMYTSLDNPTGSNSTVYDSSGPLPGNHYVVNLRGYFLAPESGIYTFNTTQADDFVSVWVGPQAYSGWNNGNAQALAYFQSGTSNPGPGSSVFFLRLTAGQYYPIRVVYTQFNGAATFVFALTSPSGQQLLSGNPSSSSPFVMQYSADGGQLAPQYSAFGQET